MGGRKSCTEYCASRMHESKYKGCWDDATITFKCSHLCEGSQTQCNDDCPDNIDGKADSRCDSNEWPNWWPQQKFNICRDVCYNNHNYGAEQTPVENPQVAIEKASAEEPTGEAKSSTELGRKSCTEYCASRMHESKYKGCWDDATITFKCSHLCEGAKANVRMIAQTTLME